MKRVKRGSSEGRDAHPFTFFIYTYIYLTSFKLSSRKYSDTLPILAWESYCVFISFYRLCFILFFFFVSYRDIQYISQLYGKLFLPNLFYCFSFQRQKKKKQILHLFNKRISSDAILFLLYIHIAPLIREKSTIESAHALKIL